jgi:hypothetical protein
MFFILLLNNRFTDLPFLEMVHCLQLLFIIVMTICQSVKKLPFGIQITCLKQVMSICYHKLMYTGEKDFIIMNKELQQKCKLIENEAKNLERRVQELSFRSEISITGDMLPSKLVKFSRQFI